MALDARKFDVSETYNHNRTNGNKQHMRENLTARIFLIDLDARKFSCAKISTFTVYSIHVKGHLLERSFFAASIQWHSKMVLPIQN